MEYIYQGAHPPFLVRAINVGARMADKAGLSATKLDADSLIQKAERTTGLGYWEDDLDVQTWTRRWCTRSMRRLG
jgi:hypothetical protein